ncbi:MAG: PAS domain-containing sensor histidine kinase [Deltaproteobacteria bacterium]|nr:MAG: PAS domain-containing sensor histidine kinase [Deltaproteobacteria bacterium]
MTRDRRIALFVLLGGLPGAAIALSLLWQYQHSQALRWTLAALIATALIGFALALQSQIVRPLQTLSNMLAAIREGDYSLRAREEFDDDSFGLALREANAIAEALRGQRLDSLEASALLGTVMDEIEVAVFAFDPEERLRFANRAGALLFHKPQEALLARSAEQLGLREALQLKRPRTIDLAFPSGMGRWEVRTRTVRLGGVQHRLVVLADLRRALREEERQAWQRLIRVLSHEINNSLTPIQSIAQSLQSPRIRPEDLREGLNAIAARAEAVSRFMAAYARLARLPPPRLSDVQVAAWVRRVAALETRITVTVEGGPEVVVQADADQLDQLLINLLANAAEATLEAGGSEVRLGWRAGDGEVEVSVVDSGPGLPASANLFTPFFTTKKSGSGIGLVLSRQIAENHGGSLTVENRLSMRGAVARVRLPRA